MATPELIQSPASNRDAELARVAQRLLMTALDHSRASRIALVDETQDGAPPVLELPPAALRFLADILGMMARQEPIALLPQKHELSTQEAAALLNVSRPFVVKEIDAGRLRCRKVGRHRRVEFHDLQRYAERLRKESEAALQELADIAQQDQMGY